MAQPVFTNVDAQALWEISLTLSDESVVVRMQSIATHLQSLDDKYQHLLGNAARKLSRSNLPPQSTELSREVLEAMEKLPVTKIPTGLTSKKKEQRAKAVKDDPLAGLELNLDLSDLF